MEGIVALGMHPAVFETFRWNPLRASFTGGTASRRPLESKVASELEQRLLELLQEISHMNSLGQNPLPREGV